MCSFFIIKLGLNVRDNILSRLSFYFISIEFS